MCCSNKRPACYSCGRRGRCHKRSCATRNPIAPAILPTHRIVNNNATYGVRDAAALDGPPAYESVVSVNGDVKRKRGVWGWSGGRGVEGNIGASRVAFEAGRIAGREERRPNGRFPIPDWVTAGEGRYDMKRGVDLGC